MKWYWAILFTLAILAATLVVSQLVGFDLVWILVFGTALWAAIDSSRLELKEYKAAISDPVILFVSIALLWIVGFPWYLAVRYKITHGLIELRQPEAQLGDRLAQVLAWGLVSAIVLLPPTIQLVTSDPLVDFVTLLLGVLGSPLVLLVALCDASRHYRYSWLVVLAAAAATTFWGFRIASL